MGIEIEEPIREAFVCDTLFKKYQVHADWHEDRIPLTHESLTVICFQVITRKKEPLINESHLLWAFICVAPI
jgi:hypothetical protein